MKKGVYGVFKLLNISYKKKMEERWNQRTELLIGIKGIEKLKKATVIIYGIGGVGSYVAEGLARAGVGKLILVDPDDISITNINRQIIKNSYD